MKFKYKKFDDNVIRPIIPIEIQFENNKIGYEVLVDSGADDCIFDGELAEILGIRIESGIEKSVAGITGVKQPYFLHPIILVVGGWSKKIVAGFMPQMPKLGFGVVGQKGFFDLFIVKFDYVKAVVELQTRQ